MNWEFKHSVKCRVRIRKMREDKLTISLRKLIREKDVSEAIEERGGRSVDRSSVG